jgi:transcription elongation factor Elf1
VGRKARLKRERRQKRREILDESWRFFTSRGFLRQVRQMIHDAGIDVHSSVAATRIFCELGHDVGLNIQPLSVEVNVYNPVFTAYIEKNGLNPSDEEMTEMGEAGGRYVCLGSKDEDRPRAEGTWLGHLVAVMLVKGKPATVVDLTIDKAHRPTDDIALVDPLIFGCPPGFLDGKDVAEGIIGTPKGKICLVYRAIPDDLSFEGHIDWTRDYAAKAHDKIDFGEMPQAAPAPSGLLGPDGLPLESSGE